MCGGSDNRMEEVTGIRWYWFSWKHLIQLQNLKGRNQMGEARHISDYEIVPIDPSTYASNVLGIWYFVIGQTNGRTTFGTSLVHRSKLVVSD